MKRLLILFVFITPFLTFAQQQPQSDFDPFYLNENIPSSPEASGLGAYGDITGNPYNGRANINIPIHTIGFGNLKLPIGLNYDSGGVKVAEDASWVGLNWNLSTSFGISQKINGQNDFDDTYAINANGKVGFVYSEYDVQHPSGSAPFIEQNDLYDIHNSYLPQSGKLKSVDLQPDIFEVSLFGNSYKFRMNKKPANSNIVSAFVFNDNNAKIEYNLGTETFQIIDDRGYVYIFSTKEFATNFTSTPNFTQASSPTTIPSTARQRIQNDWNGFEETVITSWKLNSVQSPTGEMLNFNYQSGLHFTFPSTNGYKDFNDISAFTGGQGGISGAFFNATTTALETKYLTSITGDFGSVEFILGTRDDLLSGYELRAYCNIPGSIDFVTSNLNSSNGEYIAGCHGQSGCNFGTQLTDYRLNQIKIKDYDGVLVEDISLSYSYFNIDEINNPNKEQYLRLKLNEVNIGDKKYTLSYSNPNDLAPKDSFDVDFWGYFNDAGNTHNVPSIGRFYTTSDAINGQSTLLQNYINYTGANRSSDFDSGKNGLLRKISFPTGGYTELIYEGHKALIEATQPYIVTEALPNGNIRWTTFTDESKYKFTYQYLKRASDPSYNLFNEEYVPPQGDPIISEVNVGQNAAFSSNFPIVLTADCTLVCQYNCSSSNFYPYLDEPSYVIKRQSDGQISNIIFEYQDFPESTGLPGENGNNVIFLPPGNYFVSQEVAPWQSGDVLGAPALHIPEAHTQNDGQFKVETYSSGGNLPTLLEQFEIGGARIAAITNYDSDGKFIVKSAFDYTFFDANDATVNSSGKLVDEFIFFSKTYGHNSYNPLPWSTSTLNFQSNSALPATRSAQGSHVGYSQVRQLILDSSDFVLGETINNFFNEPNLYYTESFCREYNMTTQIDPDACIDNTFVSGLGAKETFDFMNGQLLSKTIFNSAGYKVLTEEYEYGNLIGQVDTDFYASVVPLQYNIQDVPTDGSSYYTYQFPVDFALKSVLTKKNTTQFLGDGSASLNPPKLFSEETYLYNANTHHLLEKETEIFEGDRIKQKFFYPYSSEVSSEPEMLTLRNENQLSTIVMTESFRNASKLSETHYSFANFGNNTLANLVSTGKGNQSVLTPGTSYNRYNDSGRLLQMTPASGLPTSLIWGYNNQYVIAKVENVSYATIEALSAFGSNFSINDALSSVQENQLRNLAGAMVTTFTYIPGIGVETITDPRNYTYSHVYDAENRLKYTKDQDNNILEEFLYNLNNDNIPEDIIEGPLGGGNSLADSDGDGWTDDLENLQNTNSLDSCSFPYGQSIQDAWPSATWNDMDCDGDGVSNGDEMINGNSPLIDDSGGGGSSSPSSLISMQDYLNTDRTFNQETGYDKLTAYIQFTDQSAYSNSALLSFSPLAFGGSGNFQYRWRTKGEDFPVSYTSSSSYSLPFACSQYLENKLGVVCEVKDMVTGEIVTARWSNVIQLECN